MVFKVIPISILGDECMSVVVEWYGGIDYGGLGAGAKGLNNR